VIPCPPFYLIWLERAKLTRVIKGLVPDLVEVGGANTFVVC
jgi:hypothetical protein